MPTLTEPDRIAVWTEDGMPARCAWRGTRYRVTDTPTPLYDELSHPLITHPARRQIGWRFQGTPDRGLSLMFDVLTDADGWRVLRTYN